MWIDIIYKTVFHLFGQFYCVYGVGSGSNSDSVMVVVVVNKVVMMMMVTDDSGGVYSRGRGWGWGCDCSGIDGANSCNGEQYYVSYKGGGYSGIGSNVIVVTVVIVVAGNGDGVSYGDGVIV